MHVNTFNVCGRCLMVRKYFKTNTFALRSSDSQLLVGVEIQPRKVGRCYPFKRQIRLCFCCISVKKFLKDFYPIWFMLSTFLVVINTNRSWRRVGLMILLGVRSETLITE